MEAGREMDALVAKAIGKPATAVCPECGANVNEGLLYPGIGCTRPCGWKMAYISGAHLCPNYSTDIAAAMTVVEHLSKEFCCIQLHFRYDSGDHWDAQVSDHDGKDDIETTGRTLPEAICRAALAVAGVEA